MSGERVDWSASTPISTTNLNYMNTPAGVVADFAGATPPTGWLLCDGKTIGPTGSGADYTGDKYEALYDIIQNLYGGTYNWAGGGKVNLPNAVDKVVIAAGTKTLAATGGSETIATENLPAHGHALTMDAVPAHAHSGATGSSTDEIPTSGPGGVKGTTYIASPNATFANDVNTQGHTHTIPSDGGHTPTGTANNTGGGVAYNPPYIALNKIIKY